MDRQRVNTAARQAISTPATSARFSPIHPASLSAEDSNSSMMSGAGARLATQPRFYYRWHFVNPRHCNGAAVSEYDYQVFLHTGAAEADSQRRLEERQVGCGQDQVGQPFP